MNKKYLLLFIIVCIFGGVFFINQIIQIQLNQPEEKYETDLSIEEIPEREFKNLKLTYYGEDQQYKMNTTFQKFSEEANGNINFLGMEAVLVDGEEILNELTTPEGLMINDGGIVKLKGPVTLDTDKYQISMGEVDIDLNLGQLHALGLITVQSEDIFIQAKEMSSDLKLTKIHFKGRPRLIVKKGG
ncbi:MAG: hypothetical protein KAX49_02390 [Halanaerobiales bacterium]|nr:hypothetical protein [Halanaerobiales bacterium]